MTAYGSPRQILAAAPATAFDFTPLSGAPASVEDWRDLIGVLRGQVAFRDAVVDTGAHAGPDDTGWRIPLGTEVCTPEPPPPGGPAHALDLLLREPADTVLRIRLLREPGDAFTAEDAALLARSGPLLRLLLCRMRGAPGVVARHETHFGEALLSVFDQLGLGLCLVDAEMRAPLVSGRAVASGVVKRRRDSIGIADREAEARLRSAVAAVLRTPDPVVHGVNLGDGVRPAYALVTALRAPSGAAPAPLAVVILLPRDPPEHAERVIQTLFGLTPVEARLTKLLADGLTLAEAAAEMRMRPNTLRSYMKSIFVKLDLHRQSELVRLVSTTAGLLRGMKPPAAARENCASAA
jgi:DNA-binding CsgD family transcriptional regulator